MAEFVASVTAAREAIGQTVTPEAMEGALAERERRRAARRMQRRPQLFGPQTGGSNMQLGPHAKKNKMKKEKKERRAREKEGEVVEEMRKAHRTANQKLLAELRLITAAAARLQQGRQRTTSGWSGDVEWSAEGRAGGSWEGGGSSGPWQPSGWGDRPGAGGSWQGNRRWGGPR